MGGWPCSFYGKKNPMFWLWQIFLKMLEEVWNNRQQNLWFRENDTCMRFSRSSLACATRHKSPTFPVLSCSKRDYIDPSREKSPKPNGKGVQRHSQWVKSRSKFSIRPWYQKKTSSSTTPGHQDLCDSWASEQLDQLFPSAADKSDASTPQKYVRRGCARNCWPWKQTGSNPAYDI